jgi:uncharacterized protein (TIGR00369 family)
MSPGSFEFDLGLAVTRRHKDGVTCRLPLRPELFNSEGTVHGGVLAAVADEVAWHAILHVAGDPLRMSTAELKVNYLRPVTGKHLTARGIVLKLGRFLMVTRIDLHDERRRLAAHATVTYARLNNPKSARHQTR